MYTKEIQDFFRGVSTYRVTSSIRGWSLVANRFIAKGEELISFDQLTPQLRRTYQTVQVDSDRHVLEDEVLAKLNHSCDPNVTVDTIKRICIASRDIRVDEELSFFYPSTETKMIQPFPCRCGSKKCIGWVKGALELPPEVLAPYGLNPHVRTELELARWNTA